MDTARQKVIEQAHTVVIKVGSNVLADPAGRLDRSRIESLAGQLQRIRAAGRRVVLVSSGAVGSGMGRLGLPRRPTDLPHLQACAAVGQSALMQVYQECLAGYGIHTAQILLTAGDFDNRARYLNVRNTILTLFEYEALPIINENDTVSVAEIRFGDNDHLAAMVTNLLCAPLLVLLTNVNGLYNCDPRANPNAEIVGTVPVIDHSVTEMAGASRSHLGTGGMRSKLRAALLATTAGEAVIMANGSQDGVIDRIFAGEPVGTLFLPRGEDVPAWTRWGGYTARPQGKLLLDDGARRAVVERGRSLLAVGVKAVEGDFRKGDIISICDETGREVARGLCNYGSLDAEKIRGKSKDQVAAILGAVPYEEMVHRDNLVVTA